MSGHDAHSTTHSIIPFAMLVMSIRCGQLVLMAGTHGKNRHRYCDVDNGASALSLSYASNITLAQLLVAVSRSDTKGTIDLLTRCDRSCLDLREHVSRDGEGVIHKRIPISGAHGLCLTYSPQFTNGIVSGIHRIVAGIRLPSATAGAFVIS